MSRIRGTNDEKQDQGTKAKNNLTLRELGKKVDMSSSRISQYETGKREPKLETWKKLADYFNVSVPYLQGLTNIDIIQNDRPYSKWEAVEYIKKAMYALAVTQDDLI